MITQERLKELLNYDPETGVFTWRIRRTYMAPGSVAGQTNTLGYRMISVDGKLYLAHRLAWLYTHGVWPSRLDHKNRRRSGTKIGDLRIATQSQNIANSSLSRLNKSGYKGVSWAPRQKKWHAKIKVNYKAHHLGYFKNVEDAAAAYKAAAEKFFGEFANA